MDNMKRLIESQITLISQTDIILSPIRISYNDDEVEITLIYNGSEYRVTGNDHLWMDAFADLQRMLPSNTQIACCMTCQHGNMCPYGNEENRLYCTKDAIINSKDDVIALIDKDTAFFERKVSAINFCDNFVYQSKDCYTYNDYLYHLQKTNW